MFKTAIALTIAGLLSLSSAAVAAPRVDGEFDVSDTPKHLTLGPDGNVWAAVGGKIARITPAGVVTEFDPTDVGTPNGITTGPDGNLWVSQDDGVARIPPADPLQAKKFTIAQIQSPQAIVTGPDGNLWTASGKEIVRIPPADPTMFKNFTVNDLMARGIAAGGDGRLWVVDRDDGRILRVTTDGVVEPIPVGGAPQEIAAGPGTEIAYTNPDGADHRVGRLVPGGSPLTSPTGTTDPFGITFGPDGAFWFAEFGTQTIGRLTRDGQVTHLGGFSAGSGPRHITAGPGNTLWVALEGGKKIARVSGVEPQVAQPGQGGGPQGGADRTAPTIARLAVSRGRVRFKLSEPARVRISIRRKGARRARAIVRRGVRGRNVVRLGRHARRRGRYVLTVTAVDAAGNRSKPARVRFRR